MNDINSRLYLFALVASSLIYRPFN